MGRPGRSIPFSFPSHPLCLPNCPGRAMLQLPTLLHAYVPVRSHGPFRLSFIYLVPSSHLPVTLPSLPQLCCFVLLCFFFSPSSPFPSRGRSGTSLAARPPVNRPSPFKSSLGSLLSTQSICRISPSSSFLASKAAVVHPPPTFRRPQRLLFARHVEHGRQQRRRCCC